MPPHFTLSAVLRVRERKQEQEERTLADLGMQRRNLTETLRRVDEQLAQWTGKREQEIGSVCNAATQQASYAYYKALSEGRVQLLEQLRLLETRWQEQRRLYLAARSDRQMLAQLKEQQRIEWEIDCERRDTRVISDLFAARRFRV